MHGQLWLLLCNLLVDCKRFRKNNCTTSGRSTFHIENIYITSRIVQIFSFLYSYIIFTKGKVK